MPPILTVQYCIPQNMILEYYGLGRRWYHKWTCMMNPLKHTSAGSDRLWSKWVESTRKDVECSFGILNSRWRLLRDCIVQETQNDTYDSEYQKCTRHLC
jgi:Plant transposon protein